MMNKLLYTLLATAITVGAYAQKSDGTTKSLVKAEQEFAASLAKNGAKNAYVEYSANDALVFRPNPVNAKGYYATQPNSKELSWKPVYAKVSRSGDWGFTTGPFVDNGETKTYGQFLSLWKEVNGKWELAMDLGVEHNKPLKTASPTFVEPKDFFKPKFANAKEKAAQVDIIVTTEKTLSTTLKSYGIAAFGGFFNHDVRVLFPGYEPILGKDNALAFFNGMVKDISLKTTKANRAAGGDLAYTYGVAAIDYKADLRESFNYIFIYERQADHSWNLIVQAFTPAER